MGCGHTFATQFSASRSLQRDAAPPTALGAAAAAAAAGTSCALPFPFTLGAAALPSAAWLLRPLRVPAVTSSASRSERAGRQ